MPPAPLPPPPRRPPAALLALPLPLSPPAGALSVFGALSCGSASVNDVGGGGAAGAPAGVFPNQQQSSTAEHAARTELGSGAGMTHELGRLRECD